MRFFTARRERALGHGLMAIWAPVPSVASFGTVVNLVFAGIAFLRFAASTFGLEGD